MAEGLATYSVRITLRPPDGMPPEVADALPTIGAGNTEDVSGPFLPTNDLLGSVLKEVVQEATQLVANVTVERVDI